MQGHSHMHSHQNRNQRVRYRYTDNIAYMLFERSTSALCVQQRAACILTSVTASFLSVSTLCPGHHTVPSQTSAQYTHSFCHLVFRDDFLPSCISLAPQCDIEQPPLSARDQPWTIFPHATVTCFCRGSFTWCTNRYLHDSACEMTTVASLRAVHLL